MYSGMGTRLEIRTIKKIHPLGMDLRRLQISDR